MNGESNCKNNGEDGVMFEILRNKGRKADGERNEDKGDY